MPGSPTSASKAQRIVQAERHVARDRRHCASDHVGEARLGAHDRELLLARAIDRRA